MILTENKVNFNSLEQEIFKLCCNLGCELLRNVLVSYDEELMLSRDRTQYRHKGKRKTVLKTLMGEVEYERAVYQHKNCDGKKEHIFLLDKALELDTFGFISSLLSEKIAEQSCNMAYRKAAKSVSEMTGQTISHTAAWSLVQKIGQRLDKEEQKATKLAKDNKGEGEKVIDLLFEEQDGIWINMQGKSRKKRGKSYEMKVAIAYTGAKKTGKERFELTGKVACANFEGSNDFYSRKEGVIGKHFRTDEIKIRILNGDGAPWIKRSLIDEDIHYQLDTFHRNKAINTYVANPQMRKEIFKLLYTKQIDDMLIYIDACANSVDDEKESENLRQLHTYFSNNKYGLITYIERGLDLPQPENDNVYRNCGAMESNIFSIIGNRMKGNRTCWSENGGNNLAKLLCLKATKKLSETLQSLTTIILPQKYEEQAITALSAKKIPERVGKGYNGFMKASIPSSQKWLKDFLKFTDFSDFSY